MNTVWWLHMVVIKDMLAEIQRKGNSSYYCWLYITDLCVAGYNQCEEKI